MKQPLLVCVAVLSLLLTQCTKDPLNNLTREESRIYVTNYDTTAVFSDYKTFKIADSVANIENNQLQSKTNGALETQMIDAVRNTLTQRGFTPVSGSENADLGVTVSTITNTSTHLVDYSNYGGYYGGYWDPYYWGYSDYSYYFPSYYGLYQTDETVLSIDIIDLKHAAQNGNKLEVIWSGLIRGSGIFSASTINSQIAALFEQSPYLKPIQ
jgi:hypothetical protein